jgi:hypothetical protein
MIQHIKKNWAGIICAGIPVFITGTFALLAMNSDLRLAIPFLVFCTAFVTSLLVLDLYLNEKVSEKRRNRLHSPAGILFIALIIRLFFVCQPVQLSDDLFRYYTDGHMLITGSNPYTRAPSAITDPSPLISSIVQKVNHPELITIYPPAAQIIFAAGALSNSLSGMKALLIMLDLGTVLVLMIVLKNLGLPVYRSVLYAWHPLPVLEIASSGHIDGAAIFFLVLSFFLLHNGKTIAILFSGFFFACAFLTKLFPVVFFPVFFLLADKGKRLSYTTGFVIGLLILTVPFFPDIVNTLDTLVIYTKTWEFGGFLFRLLRQITNSGTVSRMILAVAFITSALFLSFRFGYSSDNQKKPDYTKALRVCYGISLLYLLLTPTLHPWYALYLVFFLPFYPGPAGIGLSWAVFHGYYILTPYAILGIWEENSLVPILIFLTPVLVKTGCLIFKDSATASLKQPQNR